VAPVLRGLACALAAALIALPVAVERAVEQVRFSDHLGTFPVEVGLCHDGRSTLDTGLFGKVFWQQAAGALVYLLMAVILLWKPEGLFKQGT